MLPTKKINFNTILQPQENRGGLYLGNVHSLNDTDILK